MPRLMMSRPCWLSAVARASTAKAFSSPIRSKSATVRSIGVSSSVVIPGRRAGGEPGIHNHKRSEFARPGVMDPGSRGLWRLGRDDTEGSAFLLVIQPGDPHLGHAHHLEDDRDRPTDQQQAVERRDRPDQPFARARNRIAVAERGVILEGELK